MSKVILTKPTLIILYGFPGAGKTFFGRQLATDIHAAHLQADRIRYELFEDPDNSKNENSIVSNLTDYMAEEFLNAGNSVIYDSTAMRTAQRRDLKQKIIKTKAQTLIVWIQIDVESAFTRVASRDRRKVDDKFTTDMDRTSFDDQLTKMQNPQQNENYVVISGKHNYQMQRSAVMKKFFDLGLIHGTTATDNMVKPGMVNLVPTQSGGRFDDSRRNIAIRG
ncbi:MAG: ATP-binding protein [Candidatus Saccharibacteria bacterium]